MVRRTAIAVMLVVVVPLLAIAAFVAVVLRNYEEDRAMCTELTGTASGREWELCFEDGVVPTRG